MTSGIIQQDVNLIDLLNQRQQMVQKAFEQAWNKQSDISISNSEWYIITCIFKKEDRGTGPSSQPGLPISHVTKNIDISRQAIHKLVKNLSAKKIIEVHKMEDNKRERRITLTAFGMDVYKAHTALKVQIEKEFAKKVGQEQVEILKDILLQDWEM